MKCKRCCGTGRPDNHVTGEVECSNCEGCGTEMLTATELFNQYSIKDIRDALTLAAEEWDYAIHHGLHEVGIPVSDILRALANEPTVFDRIYHKCPARKWQLACPYPSVCEGMECCADGTDEFNLTLENVAKSLDKAVNNWVAFEAPLVNTKGRYWRDLECVRAALRNLLKDDATKGHMYYCSFGDKNCEFGADPERCICGKGPR